MFFDKDSNNPTLDKIKQIFAKIDEGKNKASHQEELEIMKILSTSGEMEKELSRSNFREKTITEHVSQSTLRRVQSLSSLSRSSSAQGQSTPTPTFTSISTASPKATAIDEEEEHNSLSMDSWS